MLNPISYIFSFSTPSADKVAYDPKIPKKEQIDAWALEIAYGLDEGFEWHELADVVKKSSECIAELSDLNLDQRRQTVVLILDQLIDITDTPYLPDSIADPIFKQIVPHFVNLFINDGFNPTLVAILTEKPTPEMIVQSVRETLNSFEQKIQWKDFALAAESAILYSEGFSELSEAQRAEIAKDFVDFFIDEMPHAPLLPDSITHPILKAMLHRAIDFIYKTA